MANLIKIIQIDINNYIDNLWANGDRGEDIIITLYDCRINGIDTIEKAETAYSEWLKQKGEQL